ncbi:unannotated protein [freshwater metagenome]|uniref:Unannotated protein n=1 Tax=freshwater metagenome TaxID=449393 RepID=A0A6J6AGF2_9ZZZZ
MISNAKTLSLNIARASWVMFASGDSTVVSFMPSPMTRNPARDETIAAITMPVTPRPMMAANGRWLVIGSTDKSSAWSTPSNIMTNKNNTTMAPAYTMT